MKLRDSVTGTRRKGYVDHVTTVEEVIPPAVKERLKALRKKLESA